VRAGGFLLGAEAALDLMRELPRLNQSLRPTKNKQNKTNKQTNKQTNHTNKQTNRSPFPPWAWVAFSRQL
jgi:hypothetical protein